MAVGANAQDTWTVAGTQPLVDKSWDPSDATADMTSEDGVNFTYVKEDIVLEAGTQYQFKVVKNHAWGEEYPSQNYVFTVEETATYTVTIRFNLDSKEVGASTEKTGSAGPVTHTYSVIGTLVGNWDTDTDMEKGDDGLYKAVFENVAKGNYKFKVRVDKDWSVSYPGSDYVLTVEEDNSTIIITFDEETHEVKATGGSAAPVTHTYSVIGTLVGNWDTDTDMEKGDDGLYKAVFENVTQGNYLFKVRADKDWTISYPGENYELTVEQDNATITITFNEETNEVKATVDASTGITTAKMANMHSTQRYSLAGQRVDASYKGVIILNGKKVLVK